MISPGETEAGTAGRNRAEGQSGGLIDALQRGSSSPPALCTERKQSSADRPPCLENPRPKGRTLTNGERRFHFRLNQDSALTPLPSSARRATALLVSLSVL